MDIFKKSAAKGSVGKATLDAFKELLVSRTQYLNLLKNSPDIIYVLDQEGRFLFIEGSLKKILGYTSEELLGKHFSSIVHPEDIERAQFRFNERRTGERATTGFEIRLITKMGKEKPIKNTCVTIELSAFGAYKKAIGENKNVFIGTYGIARDITKQKRVETNLYKSKQTLQSVFDGIPDPMILVEQDLTIKRLNLAALHHFNLSKFESALGKPCYEGLRKRKTSCTGCRIPSEIKKSNYVSFEQDDPIYPEKKCLISIYPIKDTEKQDIKIIHLKDITQAKVLEQRMIQHEKMASLGFLVSGITHEINNPNNFISFNIPILREYVLKIFPIVDAYANQNPDIEFFGMSYKEFRQDFFRLLDNIQHGSERITKIVSELKDFSHSREGVEFKAVILRDILDKAIAFCRKKIERMVKNFEVDFSGSNILIITFPEGLEQIIVNLIINAAQSFDKNDSYIKIKVTNNPGQNVIIEIADNGKGIPKEMLNRIFDPFFTTKPSGQGTGLGLAVCQTLAENMGAKISVKSELGKGSTFSIILPFNAYKGLRDER